MPRKRCPSFSACSSRVAPTRTGVALWDVRAISAPAGAPETGSFSPDPEPAGVQFPDVPDFDSAVSETLSPALRSVPLSIHSCAAEIVYENSCGASVWADPIAGRRNVRERTMQQRFTVRPPLERAFNYAKKQIALGLVQGEAVF